MTSARRRTSHHAVVTTLALMAAWTAGCGGIHPVALDPTQRAKLSTFTATLRGNPMEAHLATPPAPRAKDVLVLYASGDGGWFGAAVDMFRAIGDSGFYAVGVSSRSLLHREIGARGAPGVGDLADDYQALLDQAIEALHLPATTRIVLTGWSRGASLAVLVAGPHHAPRGLAGIVAIGLAADDNLDIHQDSDEDPIGDTPTERAPGTVDLYDLIGEIAPRRCAVIQSSGDRYLTAAQARELFGRDTAERRFFAVAASNHRFTGAGPAFAVSLGEALRWVIGSNAQKAEP